MRYNVIAIARANHPGFRRAGVFFSSSQPTVIDAAELDAARLAAILSEPMLIAEAIAETTQPVAVDKPKRGRRRKQ